MIDPKTLMIGNYLQLLGNTVEVTGIQCLEGRPEMYWISTKESIPTKIIHFKPIPLTEQWLLDFGFEKAANGWFNLDFESYMPPYGLESEINQMSYNLHSGRFCVIEKYEEAIPSAIGYKVAFVNQIQNLILTLTGHHLKLKK